MDSTRLIHILIAYLVLFSFISCKKEKLESLFKNKSFIECNINGKFVRGEGLRKAFDAPSNFHMNYSYDEDETFTFNINKSVQDKEGWDYRVYLSVTQKALPQLGERYYFKKQIDNNGPFIFEDKCYIASIEVTPFLYQCADTSLLPREIRKKRIVLKTNIVKSGYIEFTKIDIDKGEIFGLFSFEAKGTSLQVPEASYNAVVTEGKFEGYHIERDRTFYTPGLFDIIF